MGFNPMEKMKAAAAAKLDEAKASVKNKASELKDSALEKAKEGASAAGEAIKAKASDAWDDLKNGQKPVEVNHITTADDYTGDLECPVSVCLLDYFEQIYGKIEPEETDDPSDYSSYDKSDCCAECGTPFVVAGSYYDYIIESFDKEQNALIKKDKEIKGKKFCCHECAKKFFEKKYPGCFVTENRDEYEARLMAGRKKIGQVSFGDKLANRAAAQMKQVEKQNEILKKNREAIAERRKGGLLGALFPFLKPFLKK